MLEQVAVVGDELERRGVAERDVVEARWPGVQNAETVLAPFDVKIRLNLAVRRHLVAEETILIEHVVGELAVAVETLVGQRDRHIVGAARQSQRDGIRVLLVARILLVEEEMESRQAAIDVLRSE